MLIDQHKEPKLDFAPQQTRSKSKIEQEEQQQVGNFSDQVT